MKANVFYETYWQKDKAPPRKDGPVGPSPESRGNIPSEGEKQMSKAPVSFIIPTLNEERNLRECLLSVVSWADEVLVLDSFSNDRTLEIAKEFSVQVVQRHFDNFSAQKNWALDNLSFHHDWVFFLDADERVTDPLREEICGTLKNLTCPYDGYFVAIRNYFMGKWVCHGGWYPIWNLRFFKHRLGRYEDRIVHEHVVLNGRVGCLENDLLQFDCKGLERYFDRHNVYSSMEALEVYYLLQGRKGQYLKPSLFARGPERRRLLKEIAYRYLPCRPLFKFIWMYFFQRGFLDGRIGFRYCLLQTLYEYQVSLKLLELRSDPLSPIFQKHQKSVSGKTTTGKASDEEVATKPVQQVEG